MAFVVKRVTAVEACVPTIAGTIEIARGVARARIGSACQRAEAPAIVCAVRSAIEPACACGIRRGAGPNLGPPSFGASSCGRSCVSGVRRHPEKREPLSADNGDWQPEGRFYGNASMKSVRPDFTFLAPATRTRIWRSCHSPLVVECATVRSPDEAHPFHSLSQLLPFTRPRRGVQCQRGLHRTSGYQWRWRLGRRRRLDW